MRQEKNLEINEQFEDFIIQQSNLDNRQLLFHRSTKNIVKKTLFENQNPNLQQEATELQEDCCEYMDMLDNYLNLKQYTEIIEYNNNPYKYISIIPEN